VQPWEGTNFLDLNERVVGKKAARHIDAWPRGEAYTPAPKHEIATADNLNTRSFYPIIAISLRCPRAERRTLRPWFAP
jgi:hypothetical protein